VVVELEAAGYEVVSTDSSTQGIALLYIMHSVAAVILQQQGRERTSFRLARSLRAIHPAVPIVLLSGAPIDCLPPCIDACLVTEPSLEKVGFAVKSLLTEESFEVQSAQC
jgi:hypothetical protein